MFFRPLPLPRGRILSNSLIVYIFAIINRERRVIGECRCVLAVAVIVGQDARMEHCIIGLILVAMDFSSFVGSTRGVIGHRVFQKLPGVHCLGRVAEREWAELTMKAEI